MSNRIMVKPSEINVSGRLCGSALGKTEREEIARNIIVICREYGDGWPEFTWDNYRNMCSHKVTDGEKYYLNLFVEMKLLSFIEGKYKVLDAFIAKLWEFVRK